MATAINTAALTGSSLDVKSIEASPQGRESQTTGRVARPAGTRAPNTTATFV